MTLSIDTSVVDRAVDLAMILDYLRCTGHRIGRLARLGDKESLIVEFTYRALYLDQKNPAKQDELIHVVKEFMARDLIKTEREILQNRYGHKVPHG